MPVDDASLAALRAQIFDGHQRRVVLEVADALGGRANFECDVEGGGCLVAQRLDVTESGVVVLGLLARQEHHFGDEEEAIVIVDGHGDAVRGAEARTATDGMNGIVRRNHQAHGGRLQQGRGEHQAGTDLVAAHDAEVGFHQLIGGDHAVEIHAVHAPRAVCEGGVVQVPVVLQGLEVVAGDVLVKTFDEAFALESGDGGKGRRRTLAEIAPDVAQMLAGGIAAQVRLRRNAGGLAGALHALAVGAVFPAVVQAPDAVLFDITHRQLHAAM